MARLPRGRSSKLRQERTREHSRTKPDSDIGGSLSHLADQPKAAMRIKRRLGAELLRVNAAGAKL